MASIINQQVSSYKEIFSSLAETPAGKGIASCVKAIAENYTAAANELPQVVTDINNSQMALDIQEGKYSVLGHTLTLGEVLAYGVGTAALVMTGIKVAICLSKKNDQRTEVEKK